MWAAGPVASNEATAKSAQGHDAYARVEAAHLPEDEARRPLGHGDETGRTGARVRRRPRVVGGNHEVQPLDRLDRRRKAPASSTAATARWPRR